MLKNLIVFGGATGSSVLTGFLARAGYWLGDETKKIAFETFENSELVEMNDRILKELGFENRDLAPPPVEHLREGAPSVDRSAYEGFLTKCNEHRPWLWKDPRLSYTIFFWDDLLDLDDCQFIIITREFKQSWTGKTLRGSRDVSLSRFETIQRRALDTPILFLREKGLPQHTVEFEDLIVKPGETIAALNDYLGTELTLDDLKAVYRGELYKKRWTRLDYLKAQTIFWTVRCARGVLPAR